jgi:hypothetical protein
MEISDWTLIGSASATFLLATAAFVSIWQNYALRREDRELNFKLRCLDEIIEWTHKTPLAILNSLEEYGTYQEKIRTNLAAQVANREAQERIKEAEARTSEKAELLNLSAELTTLERGLKELEDQCVTEDYIKLRVLGTLKEAVTEYDFLKREAGRFGQALQTSINVVEPSLRKIVELFSSDSLSGSHLNDLYECWSGCVSGLNDLALKATSMKSLLISHDAK